MTRCRPITFLASTAVIPLAALAVAACGGSGAATAATSKTNSTSTSTSTPPSKQTTRVRVANSRLGKILVNSRGRTLYLFKADSHSKSACSGACAAAWPPLLATGTTTAGPGLTASKLRTITRSGGAKQVAYNGHPLYLYVQDQKPGDVTGQGVTAFGAAWFVVSPAGNQISSQLAAHAGSSPPPAAKPAPPPAPKAAPPANNGIPQNNGGDGDADNNGGPSDGDGNI